MITSTAHISGVMDAKKRLNQAKKSVLLVKICKKIKGPGAGILSIIIYIPVVKGVTSNPSINQPIGNSPASGHLSGTPQTAARGQAWFSSKALSKSFLLPMPNLYEVWVLPVMGGTCDSHSAHLSH